MPDPSPAALKKRRRRLERGLTQETAERLARPRRGQLMLPLLSEIHALGGRARPADIYDRIAARLGLDGEVRDAVAVAGDGQRANVFDRTVRWARQTLVGNGLLDDSERGVWRLTRAGEMRLGLVRPGVVITFFETASGTAFWAHAEDAVAAIVPGSVDLILGSPPIP